jgi:hypothetical protein
VNMIPGDYRHDRSPIWLSGHRLPRRHALACGRAASPVNLAAAIRHGHPRGRGACRAGINIVATSCNHLPFYQLIKGDGTAQSAVVSKAVRCNARAAFCFAVHPVSVRQVGA